MLKQINHLLFLRARDLWSSPWELCDHHHWLRVR